MALQGKSDSFLSTAEAAQFLGLSQRSIRTYVARGKLHPQRIGQTLVFTKSECQRYQQENPGPGRPKKTNK